MAASAAVVKANVDQNIKAAAERTLQALGLDMAAGIRMFVHQVALSGGLPFEVTLPAPSKDTLAAIEDAYSGRVETTPSVAALFEGLNQKSVAG